MTDTPPPVPPHQDHPFTTSAPTPVPLEPLSEVPLAGGAPSEEPPSLLPDLSPESTDLPAAALPAEPSTRSEPVEMLDSNFPPPPPENFSDLEPVPFIASAPPAPSPSLSASSISPRHQLEAWLAAMVQSSASDLILRAGGKPSCRVDGKIRFLPGRVPGSGALLEVLNGVVGIDRMELWRETGSVDVAVHLDGLGRFRLNAYKQMGEPAVVLRRINEDPPLLESLGLPTPELKHLSARKRGIILVTGIAGSGKSTTLAAMIQHMNLHFERHVITLEDPVEMLFTEDRCVISQREVGTDCSTFYEGLRHSLRQSPDVILIGEMRDAETVNAALDATETGHLVLSTLHTVNAAQTIDRIVSFFPAEQHVQTRQRLSDNLAGVLSQRLVPRATGKGMIPAYELMTSTPHIRELLVDGRVSEISRTIDAGGEGGLISFNMSLRKLVETAVVDLEIALSASDRPDELMMALRGFQHGGEKHPTSGPQAAAGGPSGLRLSD